ncbi:Phosphoglucomutase [Alteracholeplasma palmae J233]|uniref:Phosphoglucomutase n=1 Tax=Alteracholeplasma palmae (strain ATCC 49389 / J233) TaxID=1318466 RepID=U4KRP1_ALTPJ|nr:phospho-sugar mutase [Alteracholeplasma palmae]CCV64341.1 Phosphoglucomutase [Alteracholeplasma palmae J233]
MSYKDKYNLWISQNEIDSEIKNDLLKLNEDEIKECFYKDLDFGTGGLRGLMGPGTNRINIYTIRKVTQGLANYMIKHQLSEKGVAISYDNRKNSKNFAYEAAKVLAANHIKSYIYRDLRPTPMLSFAVRKFECGAGIMITASHNPKEYNGYKVYNKQGAQLNIKQADEVISYVNKVSDPFKVYSLESNLITWIEEDFDQIYLDEVKKIKINDVLKTAKIVYSPLHGTGGTVIPKFLKQQGYDVYPYEPQMIVDPEFSNTESSNPEEKKAFNRTIEYAKKINADIILVTDPDADRLGIAVLNNNEYQLLNGNQTASMMLEYILESARKNGSIHKNGIVFSTIVSTPLIEAIANKYEQKYVTTLTGFKFIGEQAELTKNEYNYTFGSEESYGSLVSPFVRDKDAVQAVYLLSEMACYVKEKNLTLVEYMEQIYKKYGYFFEYTENISLKGIEGSQKIEKIMTYYRKNGLNLKNYQKGFVNDYQEQKYEIKPEIELPKSNVLKYFFDQFWVVLRPSGTEPKLKIYYGSNADTLEKAQEIIQNINQEILKQINEL